MKKKILRVFKEISKLEEPTKYMVVIGIIVSIIIITNTIFSRLDNLNSATSQLTNESKSVEAVSVEKKIDTIVPTQEALELSLSYNQSDINSWNDTLKNLIKIQPSWQKWDEKSVFYKENKADIQRINNIISQRISNIKKILAVMNDGKQIDVNIQKLINTDSSLFNEQESFATRINSKSDAYAEKVDKEIKQMKKSSKSSNDLISDYVYIPSEKPAAIDNSAAIAAAAAEKQAKCKKIANQCMSDIGQRIVNFQGSAYGMAAKAYGDECNKQYKKCIQ